MANWDKLTGRGNVDDRRGITATRVGGASIAGVLLLMGINYLMGGNPLDALNQIDLESIVNQVVTPADTDTTAFDGTDSYEEFASTVLGSTNDYWGRVFEEQGRTYDEPTLVLFRDATDSACGGATSNVGPHYCPGDSTLYLDETFFEALTSELGAKGGDVAEAYVIAHEVGHHVQNLYGTIAEGETSNEDSVTTELQADCFAGLWANSIKDQNVFTPGEIAEAMDAAAAVGDDRIQQKIEGAVNPETWTHGSAADRVAAFTKGYDTGNYSSCTNY